MRGYYVITQKIKETLEQDPNVNTVNTGIIQDVLLRKADMYPYSHLIVNNSTYNGSTWSFNLSVICMDIVDLSKDETQDIFLGNDNQQDVLNTQLAVINRMLEVLRRGEETNLYQLESNPNCEPFIDRFEHGVAGWTVTLDVLIANDMTVCDEVLPLYPTCEPVTYSITDSLSNVLYSGSVVSGGTLSQIIANATVTNSLGSTLASIEAEGTVELEDVNNIDSDGSTVPTPAGVAFTCTPQDLILYWELNFNDTDDIIFIPATAANVGTFTSGSGTDVGTIEVSTDAITYVALTFNFVPVNGTTYYFKRSTATVTGSYLLTGTYV